jgi:hypothetical protein
MRQRLNPTSPTKHPPSQSRWIFRGR